MEITAKGRAEVDSAKFAEDCAQVIYGEDQLGDYVGNYRTTQCLIAYTLAEREFPDWFGKYFDDGYFYCERLSAEEQDELQELEDFIDANKAEISASIKRCLQRIEDSCAKDQHCGSR
jgi:hypothetical protein